MSSLAADIYDKIEEAAEDNNLNKRPELEYLGLALQMRKATAVDIILRGAPHILIITAPRDSPSPVQDTLVALLYFDLLAPAMGIGTLWNGMLKWCLGIFPELRSQLGIPDDHLVGYSMLFGKPAVRYTRTAVQQHPQINNIN